MIFGYVRVSTKEQNESRQVEVLKNFCKELKNENIYIDKESGKDFNRSQYQALRNCLRAGDILLIKELDRLGRNKEEVKKELNFFKEKKIRVKILNIPTTLMDFPEGSEWIFDMINNILIEVLGAMAEEERNKIRSRQREGIEIAKKEGKYKGRPQKDLPDNFPKLYKQWKDKKITAIQFTTLLGLKSRTTLYKYIKRYEELENI
ncbi:recombinase family protein [Eubacterium multiforme]|uniref:DNA invertase Pin-like site-specific DNA recombinase n=1 Tax=Eubacterium multiforme TaxID=83339 RepID=A0ABT9USR6_9FIRM|nr:recombinase family protein [Eubacterium multiforme]MDQ0149340.1 DNA invertase Pin-like site-specific DNA recombinase [Eubacterium multiforme]